MLRVPSCRVGQMCKFAAVIGCPGCELQNRVTQYIQYFLETQFDFRSAVETYENSACGGHSCVCRGELSELGQGRNEVLRVRPARCKQQSEYLVLSLRILSAPPPRQMASAPIMASVQITRRTGCLGGGICNDRIRSHKLTCRVAEVGSISGLTLAIVARVLRTPYLSDALRDAHGARHRRSLRLADAKNCRRRKICSCTRNEGGHIAIHRRPCALPRFERRFQIHRRVANRSALGHQTPKQREGLRYFLWLTPVKDLCFASHLNAPPQHVPRDSPAIQRAFGCGCRSRSFRTREHSPVSSRRRKVQCQRQRTRKQVTPRPSSVSWITSGQK
ncbi:Hypothetical_protein [Hexamita inflata]|uniref:Hypothetical_protein n=1 Tax=Hexamita inflata TaxID=28002 RepID=A0AA86UR41_9EUKA|nr:Hypothetical protein HINF_LOCUS48931 [Hexamita inflata]